MKTTTSGELNKAVVHENVQAASTQDVGTKQAGIAQQKPLPAMAERLSSVGLDAATTPIKKSTQAELLKKMAAIQSAVLENGIESSERYELSGVVALHLQKEQYESRLYVNGQFFAWIKGGQIEYKDTEVGVIEGIDDMLKRSGVGTISFNTWPHSNGAYSEPKEIDISKVTFLGSDA